MWKGCGVAALVVGLLAAAPASAEWRFEYRTGPDPRYTRHHNHGHGHAYGRHYRPYRVAQPWGYYAPPRQRCWVELYPGPFGYTEVQRCQTFGYPSRY